MVPIAVLVLLFIRLGLGAQIKAPTANEKLKEKITKKISKSLAQKRKAEDQSGDEDESKSSSGTFLVGCVIVWQVSSFCFMPDELIFGHSSLKTDSEQEDSKVNVLSARPRTTALDPLALLHAEV